MELVDNNYEVLKQRVSADTVSNFIKYMKNRKNGQDIVDNFEYWYDRNDNRYILDFVRAIKGIEGIDTKINEYFGRMIKDVAYYNDTYIIVKELMPIVGRGKVLEVLREIILKVSKEQFQKIWDEIGEEESAKRRLKEEFEQEVDVGKSNDIVLVAKKLSDMDEIKESIEKRVKDIILKCNSELDLHNFIDIIKESKDIKKRIDEEFKIGLNLENSQMELLYEIVKLEKLIKDEKTKQAIYLVIKQLIEHEQGRIEEVTPLGSGENATAFKVGEYVLKIQSWWNNRQIKYDPRILQPILNKIIHDDKGYPVRKIEICDIVDNEWYEGLQEEEIDEELYKIYKEMRDRGNVWTDIKKENVGRLLKDNKVNYKTGNNDLHVEDESVEIYGRYENAPILKKGELVILDRDFIKELDRTEKIDLEYEAPESLYYIFESRYQDEKVEELDQEK